MPSPSPLWLSGCLRTRLILAGLRRIPYLWVTWSPQRGKIENSGGHVKKIKKKSLDAMTLVAVLSRRHEK